MVVKVKEIVSGYGLDKTQELLENFSIDKVTPEV